MKQFSREHEVEITDRISFVNAQKIGVKHLCPGIKIAGRNINSFRDADDTSLMAESKEELKSLLMKVKRE